MAARLAPAGAEPGQALGQSVVVTGLRGAFCPVQDLPELRRAEDRGTAGHLVDAPGKFVRILYARGVGGQIGRQLVCFLDEAGQQAFETGVAQVLAHLLHLAGIDHGRPGIG